MKRNDIERLSYRSSLLKHIIIRADYANLTDLTGLVNCLKKDEYFASSFKSSKIVNQNRLDIKSPFSLVEDKYLPVDNYHICSFYRFFNCIIEPIQDLTLDITTNSVCIDISCNKDYDCIDEYIKLMCFIVNKIQEFDSFVRFNRFGIRKVDGDDFQELDSAYKIFQSERFAHDEDFCYLKRQTSKYKGSESFITENKIRCILERSVEAFDKTFRFCLDIDTYIDERIYDLDKILSEDETRKILSEDLNNTSFLIFREFVTEEFLNKGHEKYMEKYGKA